MTPLAELLPDPSSYHAIGWVLAVLFGLATGALVIKQLFQRDPPLHREFVDQESYKRDREEIRQELSRNSSARKTNYERLEQLGREIASNQMEVAGQREAIAELSEITRENSSKTDTVLGELKVINQQVQQLVMSSFRK